MQAFEDLLHHVHRSCGGILEKMDEAREMAFLANVDYICAKDLELLHFEKKKGSPLLPLALPAATAADATAPLN